MITLALKVMKIFALNVKKLEKFIAVITASDPFIGNVLGMQRSNN